jgi:hypothetical protein
MYYPTDFIGQSRRDPSVRASDADREQAAEALGRYHTEGRLDSEELHERIDKAYAAKTLGDLDGLVSDMPRNREMPGDRQRPPLMFRFPIMALVAVLLIASLLGAVHHFPWFAIVLTFLLVRMVVFRGWGPGRWGIGRWGIGRNRAL